MIRTTKELANALENLPLDKFLIVVDQNDNNREYIIESIIKRKLYLDDDREWCYALNIRNTTGNGCIKR